MNQDEFRGHPKYLELTEDELKLHSEKNYDYTKGGDSLGNFKRVASILSNYPGLNLADPTIVALVFGLKQHDAALWMLSQGYDGKVETIDKRLQDSHIYTKIARILNEQRI